MISIRTVMLQENVYIDFYWSKTPVKKLPTRIKNAHIIISNYILWCKIQPGFFIKIVPVKYQF